MKIKIAVCSLLLAMCAGAPAFANWETTTPWVDDGARFTLSIRGGAALGFAGIKNQLGTLVPEDYWTDDDGNLYTGAMVGCDNGAECSGLTDIGAVDIANLPGDKRYNDVTWDAALAMGFTLPNHPQWRFEANWEHLGQSSYDAVPLFSGALATTDGWTLDGIQSGGVHSTMDTDIITAMAYYDFFDGTTKPLGEFIPYIGVGIGYANTTATLELTDTYGDMSSQWSMQPFGDLSSDVAIDFYSSKTTTGNFAAAAAVGFSYGVMDNLFIDLGLRITYLPSVMFAVNNDAAGDNATTGPKSKNIFSMDNMFIASALVGVRFEF